MTSARIHARRGVWASIAFEHARRGEQPNSAAARALSELLSVSAADLGDDRRGKYQDAPLRVGAVRWAQESVAAETGQFTLTAAPGDPGQTCVSIHDAHRQPDAALIRRCTYGIVWMASVHAVAPASALVLAVQLLFHVRAGAWAVDVLSPGSADPELGCVEFAGFAANSRHLLIAREVQEHGGVQRRFEELRLEDLAPEREASAPDLLRDFGRWQDMMWRRDPLVLH